MGRDSSFLLQEIDFLGLPRGFVQDSSSWWLGPAVNSHFKMFVLILCVGVWSTCINICVYRMCRCLQKPEEGVGSAGPRVRKSGKLPCRSWELNPCLPEEQPVPLTLEPALQSRGANFLISTPDHSSGLTRGLSAQPGTVGSELTQPYLLSLAYTIQHFLLWLGKLLVSPLCGPGP